MTKGPRNRYIDKYIYIIEKSGDNTITKTVDADNVVYFTPDLSQECLDDESNFPKILPEFLRPPQREEMTIIETDSRSEEIKHELAIEIKEEINDDYNDGHTQGLGFPVFLVKMFYSGSQ